jgi:outer membrane protein assembly factor BamB
MAFVLVCGVAAAIYPVRTHLAGGMPDLPTRGYEAQTGSRYLPLPDSPFKAPIVRELHVPSFADATSVWGATGRDDNGAIWVGVSAAHAGMSAHLMRYDANTDSWQDRGTVVDQLGAAGLRRKGEGQIKIHSRIIPANDGWLYFASTDEEDEDASANVPPRWGGHLWRIDPRTSRWQHLVAAREGLVAAAGVGRYIYALGYWGHVLYQYDTSTGATKRVQVGSVGGHVSRNFLADVHGHAYVPRLTAQPNGKVLAELVEYDANLKEVAATPLDYYLGTESPDANHGIVGLAYLADGRIVFTTHRGHLYAIEPRSGRSASVKAVGWFHPAGEAYAPSMFSFSGNTLLAGVTRRAGRYEWVVFDLATGISSAFPLDTKDLRDVLLYGSVSRDNAGHFYVGGWASGPTGGQRPLVLQITPAP